MKVSTETRVGEWLNDPCDVYIGRDRDRRGFGEVPIGEYGWLGNPYPLDNPDDQERQESIQRFREDFEAALDADDNDELREAVASLRGLTLGCWCRSIDEDTPRCHGDVIAEWADRLGGSGDDDD